MIKKCNKIVIVGGPGTGKTPLAKDLSSTEISTTSRNFLEYKKGQIMISVLFLIHPF